MDLGESRRKRERELLRAAASRPPPLPWLDDAGTSFLQERLSPVEAVVGPVREGEDGGVHQLPHPRVALLLAGTEPQVRNLRKKTGYSATLEPEGNRQTRGGDGPFGQSG